MCSFVQLDPQKPFPRPRPILPPPPPPPPSPTKSKLRPIARAKEELSAQRKVIFCTFCVKDHSFEKVPALEADKLIDEEWCSRINRIKPDLARRLNLPDTVKDCPNIITSASPTVKGECDSLLRMCYLAGMVRGSAVNVLADWMEEVTEAWQADLLELRDTLETGWPLQPEYLKQEAWEM